MSYAARQLTPKELVLQKHPNAFASDDSNWVYIMNKKTATENCPTCDQRWVHKVIDYNDCLGSGSSELEAWKSAARYLKLI